MSHKQLAAFITALLGIGCITYFMAVVFKGDQYKVVGGAFVMVIELLIMLITGIILVNIKKRKTIGQGVLIGAGITLLVGFGICSSF